MNLYKKIEKLKKLVQKLTEENQKLRDENSALKMSELCNSKENSLALEKAMQLIATCNEIKNDYENKILFLHKSQEEYDKLLKELRKTKTEYEKDLIRKRK